MHFRSEECMVVPDGAGAGTELQDGFRGGAGAAGRRPLGAQVRAKRRGHRPYLALPFRYAGSRIFRGELFSPSSIYSSLYSQHQGFLSNRPSRILRNLASHELQIIFLLGAILRRMTICKESIRVNLG